jgi:hypothetical protein
MSWRASRAAAPFARRPWPRAFRSLVVGVIAGLTLAHAPGSQADPAPPITPASIRAHHQALVDIATKAGGLDSGIRLNEAGREAAEYLRAKYEAAGLENVRLEEFFPNRWWPESYALEVLGGGGAPDAKLIAFPLWHCEGADDLELDVVYAGFGTSGEFRGLDVRGKAVLIDMKRILHFIASYRYTGALERAKEKGAAAVIVAEARVDSPSGNPVGSAGKIKDGRAEPAELYPLPVFSIGKSGGLELKERLKLGPVRVRMNLQYSLARGRAFNVVGELSGNGKIDEYIVVGGHYDSWFDGAIDNLGSQASLLEMARHFAGVPRAERDRTILFVSIFGHELTNDSMGHAAFVQRHPEIRGKVTCFLNIDGSGSWGWEEKDDTGEILPTGQDDKGGIFSTSWALAAIAHGAVYHYAKGPWGQYPVNSLVADLDGPIAEAGYPCLLLISKHIYYHSQLDTLDRIAPEQVYRRTLMNIEIIRGLLDSPEGYLIAVDTNPSRHLLPGQVARPDVKPEDLPPNPEPWSNEGPAELSIHIIPPNPKVFSPVIVWPGFWRSDAIVRDGAIRWDFGGWARPKKAIATGTMFFLPGTKTITVTVTDSQGRSTSISRELRVSLR